MKKDFESLLKQLGNSDGLSKETHTRMRTLLREYALMKPLREAVPSEESNPSIITTFFKRSLAFAFILVIISSAGGSLTYAAESAIPGDVLYPLKVNVTEPLKTALITTPAAQVEWQITIATRRANEAAILATEGKLSTSTQETLEERFTQSIGTALREMQTENTSQNTLLADANIAIPATHLAAYVKVFDTINQTHPTKTTVAFRNTIATAVSVLQSDTSSKHRSTEATSAPAAHVEQEARLTQDVNRLRDVAEKALIYTETQINKNTSSLTASTAAEARAKLKEAALRANEGTIYLQKNDYVDTTNAYRESLDITSELNVLIYAAAKLKVDTFASPTTSSSTQTHTGPADTTHPSHDFWKAKPENDSTETSSNTTSATSTANNGIFGATQVSTQTTEHHTDESETADNASHANESTPLPIVLPSINL